MAIDLSDPTIIAAIISIAGAFIVGVLGALYVPLFNEWMQTVLKKRSSERGSIENSYTGTKTQCGKSRGTIETMAELDFLKLQK